MFASMKTFILRKLGTPSYKLWPSDAIVSRSFYPDLEPQPLGDLLPKVNRDAIDLVLEILKFSAQQRPTAAECLEHYYFL